MNKEVTSSGGYQPTALPNLNSGIAANNKSLGNKGQFLSKAFFYQRLQLRIQSYLALRK
jgi:hypothetical protein